MDFVVKNGADVLNGVSYDNIPGGSSLFVDLIASVTRDKIRRKIALRKNIRMGIRSSLMYYMGQSVSNKGHFVCVSSCNVPYHIS